MESKDGKRRKDKYNDNDNSDEYSKGSRSKRRRSRSKTPKVNRNENSRYKRKHSKSPTPRDSKHEKHTSEQPKEAETKKDAPVRRAKETDMLNTRTGGAYIPPARLRMMQAQITDKSSVAYQRLAWEALKKSIHGHINKINVGNIGIIIKELLKENIVRGRGLLCRSVIQAQAASPTFTNVYAALVSAVNSRFPNIGELLLKRLVMQFKRGFKRNDKHICISSASFIAHLVNQKVAHEILALELLTLLVETPTDDSVEVAIAFLKECGQKLTEVSSKGVNAIFEMLRNILHEGQLDKRVQYMIEVMFQVWKDGFKDHPAVVEELELVPEEEQFTHLLMLDDATDSQDILNVFKFDEKYEENEQKYKALSKEILGSEAESGEDDGSEGSGSEDSDEDEDSEKKEVTIIDKTETNLVALRRTIYLTINSSLDFEECAHKLMKMQLKPGQEIELCHMFLDCCAEQRTYEKFYGLLAQRFCNINRIYIGPFEEIFKDSYATAHRLDTNRLRNVSKFFAHLLFTDSISWEVMECVKLNEEDTTSSSRIYIKILFQELAEYMGLKKLNDRLKDPTLQQAFSGVFPRDNPKNTRFSINFFTSIGLGGLTDELREHLKQMPKNVPPPVTEINIDSESSSDSSSSSSSSSSSDDSSSSDASGDGEKSKKKTKSKKSKRDRSKKPQTPEIEEGNQTNLSPKRWGHDGFYDTYGQGARRADYNSSEGRPSYDRRQKYQNMNGDYRQNCAKINEGQREEFRKRYNDDSYRHENSSRRERDSEYEMRQRKLDGNGKGWERDENEIRRRGDNVDKKRRRRDSDNEPGRRRDNDDERLRRRDEDEARRRKDDNREMRKRVEDEYENRRGKKPENEMRERRDYENDEIRRGDDNDNRRRKDDDIRRRNDNEEDSLQRKFDKEVTKGRGDYEKEERRRRDENETQRQKDYENEIRKRKDNLRESERKRDDKTGKRRDNDAGDRQGNSENIEKGSKDYEYVRRYRKNSREGREETRRRRSGEEDVRQKKEETRRKRNQEEDVIVKRVEFSEKNQKNRYDVDKSRKRDKKQRNDECEKAEKRRDKVKTGSDGEIKKDAKRQNKKKSEDKLNSKNDKDKKEKLSSKKKEMRKSETNSDGSTSSDSDSDSDSSTDSPDSESDTGISKPSRHKKIPRKKSSKRNNSDSDAERNNCGGRYWDHFDTDTNDRKTNKC